MREGKFIDKNIERWKSYMEDNAATPDELAKQFSYIVDDLAYSKTFYPTSKITTFINGLAAKMFQSIYQHKNKETSRLFTFWKYEIPLLFQQYHKVYFFTLGFFLLITLISVLASMHDISFIRNILGDNYVDMTEENIAKGDPFGVYKEGNSFGMFVNIASNNIRVSLLTFVLGTLAGIGTLYLLFENALMLGSFQYMFFAKGLGWKSVLVIWIHGTLEISAIVLAGTAGLIIAKGLLFPGTYTRLQSFKSCAKNGVKIIVCLIPFFIVAAFFEGYITRYTNMPIWLSLTILISSAVFIIYYFIIYPILLSKTGITVVDGIIKFPNEPS
jgi:uncharacterized membrane protein SpoIIM required for sporulation